MGSHIVQGSPEPSCLYYSSQATGLQARATVNSLKYQFRKFNTIQTINLTFLCRGMMVGKD